MLPVAYIEHQIAGRMRLRVPERRGDVGFFERAVGALSNLPAVTELDASPLTGCIRIGHTGTAEPIMTAAAQSELFELGRPERNPEPQKPAQQPTRETGMLDTIAAGLPGLALFQVTQGHITGSAAENFWNAYGAQRVLGNSVFAAGFGLLGAYQLLQGQWLGSASSLLFYALMASQLGEFERGAPALMDTAEPRPPKQKRARKRGAQKANKNSGVSG